MDEMIWGYSESIDLWFCRLKHGTLIIDNNKTASIIASGNDESFGTYRSIEAAKMAAEIWYINRSKG